MKLVQLGATMCVNVMF